MNYRRRRIKWELMFKTFYNFDRTIHYVRSGFTAQKVLMDK